MSVTLSLESDSKSMEGGQQSDGLFNGSSADVLPDESETGGSAMPVVLKTSAGTSALLPKAVTEQSVTSSSTRSVHRLAVLSLSLHPVNTNSEVKNEEAVPVGGPKDQSVTNAAASFCSSSTASPLSFQPANLVKMSSMPSSNQLPEAVLYTTPLSESHKTPMKLSKTAATPALSMLQLPINKCEDEVTPVKTLYNRLLSEAQKREQRRAQALRKQRDAQKAEEEEDCTFHPCGADAFGKSSSAKKLSSSVNNQKQIAVPANVSLPPSPVTSQNGPAALQTTQESNHSGDSTAEKETAACVRLYKNIEQTARRERRLQKLREIQEEEFRSTCTFRPDVSPSRASRQRSLSHSRHSQIVNGNSHDGNEGDKKEDNSAMRGTSLCTSGTSPSRQHWSWEHFLADQETRHSVHDRRLEELTRKAAAEDHAELFTGVLRSKASEHFRKYLEKKGYKGPVEGWAERFDHYMKVKQAAESESLIKSSKTQKKKEFSVGHTDGSARSPALGRTPSRTCSNSYGAAKGYSSSVFERLYHDNDEREATRELIRLTKEQREQAEFFKPNTEEASAPRKKGNANNESGSSSLFHHTPRGGSMRRSQNAPEKADAARETATAIAVAAGGADEEKKREFPENSHQRHEDPTARSIFDALYAEKEALLRRRELRYLQAQDNAEVFPFQPHVSERSRELAKDLALQKARGERVMTVREERARKAAEAEAREAACRGQVQFRYDSFAHRQAERDRRRKEELQRVFLQKRVEDVDACSFRPAISEVSEAIAEGRNYTQVIDDPQVVNSLIGQRASSSSDSKPAERGVSASKVESRKSSMHQNAVQFAGNNGRSTSSADAQPFLTPVQALSADAGEADFRVDAGTASQWYDALSAPVNTHSATSSNSSDNSLHRVDYRGLQHSQLQPPTKKSFSSSKESAAKNSPQLGVVKGDLSTVHIAGAASSDYLRQLEAELKDALRDWSQCI